MRRALPALFVFVLAFALALPATAATPNPKQMAGQIRALQAQVKTLQKTVKKLNINLNITASLALVSLTYSACETAVTADALQASRPDQFGTTAVTDYSPLSNNGSACGDLAKTTGTTIARQNTTPTLTVFQAILNVFKP
jgi:hypothetical protein